jgi:hypothetical protein
MHAHLEGAVEVRQRAVQVARENAQRAEHEGRRATGRQHRLPRGLLAERLGGVRVAGGHEHADDAGEDVLREAWRAQRPTEGRQRAERQLERLAGLRRLAAALQHHALQGAPQTHRASAMPRTLERNTSTQTTTRVPGSSTQRRDPPAASDTRLQPLR